MAALQWTPVVKIYGGSLDIRKGGLCKTSQAEALLHRK